MDNGEWPLHHIFFNRLRHFYRIHWLFIITFSTKNDRFIITFSTENDRFIITFFNGRRPLHLIFFNGGWLIYRYIFHEFKIDYFVVWDLWGKFFSGKVNFLKDWHWSNIPTWFQCTCMLDIHWNICEMTTHV